MSEHQARCVLCHIGREEAHTLKGHPAEECPFRMTRTIANATATEMQNLLGQGYGAIQQQLSEIRDCQATDTVHQRLDRIEEEISAAHVATQQYLLSVNERFDGNLLVVHERLDVLTRRSAAIEEKQDDIIERLDRWETRLGDLGRSLDLIAKRPALPRPAKKKRGKNGR